MTRKTAKGHSHASQPVNQANGQQGRWRELPAEESPEYTAPSPQKMSVEQAASPEAERQVAQLQRDLDAARAELQAALGELSALKGSEQKLKNEVAVLEDERTKRQEAELALKGQTELCEAANRRVKSADAKIQELEAELRKPVCASILVSCRAGAEGVLRSGYATLQENEFTGPHIAKLQSATSAFLEDPQKAANDTVTYFEQLPLAGPLVCRSREAITHTAADPAIVAATAKCRTAARRKDLPLVHKLLSLAYAVVSLVLSLALAFVHAVSPLRSAKPAVPTDE